MRCLVVDSSPESAPSLSTLLMGETDVRLLGCWRTLSEAADAIDRERPEVLFLDVDVASGLERPLVPAPPASLVALAGGPDGALVAFRLGAIHCLQKPATLECIREALTRARSRQTLAAQAELWSRLRAGRPVVTGSSAAGSRFVIRERGAARIVDASAVTWFQAEGNYVRLHVHGDRSVLLRATMGGTQAQVGRAFVRIHRSVAVRGTMIRELHHHPHGWELGLADGTTLRVGRRYLRMLKHCIVAVDEASVTTSPAEWRWG